MNKIKDLYIAEWKRIDHEISTGSLGSLKAIKDRVWRLYTNGSLQAYMFDDTYGLQAMELELVESYIIYCSVTRTIPVSGY